jgi:diacylglycerol O-acyltransferase / wax synthase
VIERTTPDDVINLATDSAIAPMQVGAVLLLDAGPDFDLTAARDALALRTSTVPRMRQRLQRVPFGCGRPIWVDDTRFDPVDHIRVESCPAPGDLTAVLEVAASLIERRLDRTRPLWSATFVTGLASGQTALIALFHHVMADGIGGLAVLAHLVDGAEVVATRPGAWVAQPAPGPCALLADAWRERVRVLTDWRRMRRRWRATLAELEAVRGNPAPRTSLNQPIGPHRKFAVVQVELGPVHAAARAHGATVNDVVLAVVAPALRDLLNSRGESADQFVVSVPVARRSAVTANELGNDVGVAPMVLGADGHFSARVKATAAMSRDLKRIPRDGDLFAPVVRALGRLHLVRPFLERQHMINTLVTNLRGPSERLSFLGTPISGTIALSVVTGNVTVAFAVLSYAGTLTITIVADPDTCPELDLLREAISRHLAELC